MAHKHRIEVAGHYHVTMRGNNKRAIVLDDHDRLMFCRTLNRVATRHGWTLLVVCLMNNHYHVIMRIGERGMSRGMCELNTAYALMFNARHGRINHLFGRRYWSEPLEDERRFMAAVRYVVQNPVEAGIVRGLEQYDWCSYRATIGLTLSVVRVAHDELLAMFADDRPTAIRSLRELCETPRSSSHVRWQPP